MYTKKLVALCLFVISLQVTAQQEIKKMAVFIGCNQYSTNKDLTNCFSQNINRFINKEIDFFGNIADYLYVGNSQAKLRFIISKDGFFRDINADGENPIFNSFVKSSLILLNNRLIESKTPISPALDYNENPVEIQLSLPVRYETNINPEIYKQLPTPERVLFSIDYEDEIIEIRENKNFELRTIGINNNREFYLGKYNNLFELAMVEPYASKINTAYEEGYIKVTSGLIDGKLYTIRLKNFFSNNPNDSILIEVLYESPNNDNEYYSYQTIEDFNKSKFAQLTYR